jgi:hypothetical protein
LPQVLSNLDTSRSSTVGETDRISQTEKSITQNILVPRNP